MTIYGQVYRQAAEMFSRSMKVAKRLELTRADLDRLNAEAEAHALTPGETGDVIKLNTPYGELDVVEAPTSAMCWRWPPARGDSYSYAVGAWYREPLEITTRQA